MKRQKWLGLIVASGLFTAILIIPTMIVVPFIGSNDVNEVQETPSSQASAGELSENLSSFSVRVLRSNSGEVEKVPLETYVARVVASEMPADFELEALKAQALAARTYITRHMVQESAVSEQADVTDTVNHQVYKNDQELRQQWQDQYASNMEKINQAVKATSGEIITYEHQPITAAFFSTSNGYTENAEDYWEDNIPYLKSVESPWDQASPKFTDQKVVSLEELQAALGIDLSVDLSQTKMTKTEGNRVEKVVFGDQTFSGREIREKLNLPSSDFTIQQKGSHVIFTTKGYGHGVGMSQYGANGMAKTGKNYKDIVHHYYQNTEISPMSTQTAALMEDEKPVN
ncbi:stage II sporulation protein D [Halobacillus sp. BBL2006]|uniref:stage II sporulation protein D n=1 Tax=Halobacillus sp. BBL2006 TaxID=1543706 RepID=UPI000541C987|nr:stage II sporulation protein D [Halobacillus sp. BBL2006]KHE68446.1 stage II sporulation protein D [Halobacillus sp. BBL2006]